MSATVSRHVTFASRLEEKPCLLAVQRMRTADFEAARVGRGSTILPTTSCV
jgi:hypothetical protein